MTILHKNIDFIILNWYNKHIIENLGGKTMPKNVNNILQQFISKVKDVLGNRLKKVILYGSYARGDYDKKSDIDIMILTDLNEEDIERYRDIISDIAFDYELEKGIVISPIIKNIDKYNIRINYIPFYSNVEREGVVLIG